MLTHCEVPAFICSKLPQLRRELQPAVNGKELSIYQSIQSLTDYTKRMAIEHDFKMVAKCMSLVDKIYEKGNQLVKNAVENVFVFSFSSIMAICNIIEWRIVQSYMPSGLYALYVRQIMRSND